MVKYLVILIGISFIVYGNSLHNDFVSDDIPDITANPRIAQVLYKYDPVGITYSLNYLIGKFNPVVYHLTNISLHALSSIFVFFFLCLFFKQNPSFFGSLLFAVHPVHTEAVTWISGRGYIIFTIFLLISFLLYVRATAFTSLEEVSPIRNSFLTKRSLLSNGEKERSSLTRFTKVQSGVFLGSVAAYVIALSACTFGLLYPGMLILYDFTFRKWRENWKYWLVFFAIVVCQLGLMVSKIGGRISQVSADIGSSGAGNFIFNMAFSIFSSLGLLFWPKNLTFYHENLNITLFLLRIEIAIIIFLIILLPLIFKKAKALFFAICFFVLFLAPTYSPAPIAWLVAERYLYFPSIALSMGLAFLIDYFPAKRKIRAAGSVLLIAALTACFVRTIIRNSDWKDHASIWRATVKVCPQSAKAHNNMGDVYCREENSQKAVEEFKRAIELKPNYADAYHNLAHTYSQLGKKDEAIENYRKAISFNSYLYQSYNNLGIIYYEKGQINLAKECFRRTLELNPNNEQIIKVLEMLEKRR